MKKKQYTTPTTATVGVQQHAALLADSYHGPAGAPELPLDPDDATDDIVGDILSLSV